MLVWGGKQFEEQPVFAVYNMGAFAIIYNYYVRIINPYMFFDKSISVNQVQPVLGSYISDRSPRLPTGKSVTSLQVSERAIFSNDPSRFLKILPYEASRESEGVKFP